EDGIRDFHVTGVQTCALPILGRAGGGGVLVAGRMVVEIRGVDSMRDRLRMMRSLVREGTEAAAREGGRMGEATMKGLAPVDTGRLRDSIRHEVQGPTVRFGPGDEIDYAAFVEFGTSKMAAQPYVRPTVEAMRRKIG